MGAGAGSLIEEEEKEEEGGETVEDGKGEESANFRAIVKAEAAREIVSAPAAECVSPAGALLSVVLSLAGFSYTIS